MNITLRHACVPAALLMLFPTLAGCTNEGLAGQTVDSTSKYTLATLPANTPLDLTAHQGLEAATVTQSSTRTLILAPAATPVASALTTADGFTLALPDATKVDYSTAAGHSDLVATQTYRDTATNNTNVVETTLTNGAASPLTYATYGTWTEKTKAGDLTSVGALAMGIVTAAGQIPTTGSANYSGNVSGFVSTVTSAARISGGTVSLIANFADKSITGTVTNITTQALDTGAAGQMNNLFLNAGKITDAAFTGTAAAAAAATTATTMDISAATTGSFGGRFYGPSAAEAAGTIALGGGGTALLASFGAKK